MTKEEIRALEENGVKVTEIDEDGRIIYRTNLNKSPKVCDSCEDLRLLQTELPGGREAYCCKVGKVIKKFSDNHEPVNFHKPDWCPKCSCGCKK